MAHNHNHHSHRRGPNRLRQIREALPDLMVEDGQLVEREAQNKATVVSVVYVTAAKTFKGPVAGYTTISPTKGKPLQRGGSDDAATAPTAQAQSEQQTPSRQQSPPPQSPSSVPAASTSRSRVPPTSRPSPSTTQRTSSSSASASRSASRPQSSSERSSLPSSIRAPKSSLESSASLMAADPTSSLSSPSEAESLAAGPTSSPSATAQPVGTSSGMTTAGKAGLAIGIIVGLGLILGLILVCLRRRSKKNEAYGKTEDEKKGFAGDGGAFGAGGGAGSVRSTRTASTAPRLSLRPVTQFSPVLDESRKSAANLLAVSGGGAGEAAADPALASQRNLTPSPQTAGGHWDRQRAVRSDANNSPVNPFGAHAEQTQAPPPGAALGDPSTSSPPLNHSAPSDIRAGHAIAPGVTGAAAGAAAARKVANHQDSPKPLDLTREFDSRPVSPVEARRAPSPTGTMNSFMTATSTGVPHGPVATLTGGPAPSSVHRVQLDFKPSMEDELELRAGTLVRLLHEYDDGWALCTHLDGQRKGVCPRTCLSTRPVKPRPSPGPHGPPRGATPANMRLPIQGNRPLGPSSVQPRPLSPANGRHSPGPRLAPPHSQQPPRRPMNPNVGRSQSPGPYGGGRHQSPGPYGGGRSQSPGPYGGGRSQSPGPYGVGRSQSPGPYGGGRSQSPGPYGGGRSQSPGPYGGGRSQSPGPYGVGRSQSPGPYGGGPPRPISPGNAGRRRSRSASSTMGRTRAPPGPSRMNPDGPLQSQRTSPRFSPPTSFAAQQQQSSPMRKPVPGQAL